MILSRFQFSLRTIFLVMTTTAVLLAVAGSVIRAREAARAKEKAEEDEIKVLFDQIYQSSPIP